LAAFSYFNIFGKADKNTKIFMGDSGSLSLGYCIGFLAVKCVMNNTNIWPTRPEAFIVPFTLVFVPTADVVRVTLHRLRHRQPLFIADKNHIHHKLMRAGLSPHMTMVTLLLLSVAFIVLNYVVASMSQTLMVIMDIVLFTLMHIIINIFIYRKERETGIKWSRIF
jgi:UDP-N-acetylmuramyl pentapeptide phosphotransferase/UDP-N-acetylglucosamine-1-phosphate transferase